MERREALDKARALIYNPATNHEWQVFADQFLIDMRNLILADRNADYGNPDADYAKAAARSGTPPEHFVRNLIDMKLSREEHKHKRDNLVDAANYCLILAFIHDRLRIAFEVTDCEDKAELTGDVVVGPQKTPEGVCATCHGEGYVYAALHPGMEPCLTCHGTGRAEGE